MHRARLRRYWQGLGWETRASVAIIVMSALALAGFFAVSWFSSSSAIGVSKTQTYVLLTTTTKPVQVKKHGAVVVVRVPVVKRLYAKPVTVQEIRTVRTPGGAKVVTRSVVRWLTDTRMLTVTNQSLATVVQHETVSETQTLNQTVVRTQTAPPETVTVTTPGDTVTVTLVPTLAVVTVTLPVFSTVTVTTTER
jgi:hypothetical protein